MTKVPQIVGDAYGDILAWRWNRGRMRFEAEHDGHKLVVQFRKVGGRWSRTLRDGTPNQRAGQSYWAAEVDGERRRVHYDTADEAKDAAAELYVHKYGRRS